MNLSSVSGVIAEDLSVFYWPGVVSACAGQSFIND
jgi:hypothetical protein